jgi:hypothetical protein
MSGEEYIGMDVHRATISVAVMDSQGNIIMESILETKASTILEFFAGLRGSLFVTFEEGTSAAWLYDLLKPHVAKVPVCNHGRMQRSSRATRLPRLTPANSPSGYASTISIRSTTAKPGT